MQPPMDPEQQMLQPVQPTNPAGQTGLSPEMNPKYRCCCGSKHILDGAKCMGYVQLIYVSWLLGSAIYNLVNSNGNDGYIVVLIFVVSVVAAILLVQGIKERNVDKLKPYILLMEVCIGAFSAIFVLSLIVTCQGAGSVLVGDDLIAAVVTLIIYCITIVVFSYFFLVAKAAKDYIVETNLLKPMGGEGTVSGGGVVLAPGPGPFPANPAPQVDPTAPGYPGPPPVPVGDVPQDSPAVATPKSASTSRDEDK